MRRSRSLSVSDWSARVLACCRLFGTPLQPGRLRSSQFFFKTSAIIAEKTAPNNAKPIDTPANALT